MCPFLVGFPVSQLLVDSTLGQVQPGAESFGTGSREKMGTQALALLHKGIETGQRPPVKKEGLANGIGA